MGLARGAVREGPRDGASICFSSPFDATAVELLEGLDAPAYKIASFEAVDLPLIARAARSGKPLIISTGMTSPAEIGEAVATARGAGAEVALLHCVSAYPAPFGRRQPADDPAPGRTLRLRGGPVGPHAGHGGRGGGGGAGRRDHREALHPGPRRRRAGRRLLARARRAEGAGRRLPQRRAALGEAAYEREASEERNRQFRRSLYVVRDVAEGEIFTEDNIRSIRPGYGLAPEHLPELLGRRAKRAIARGTPLDWPLAD